MFGLLALANAAPDYGYNNYFSGSTKPLTGSYSSCRVEWRSVKKAGYKEVTEYKEKTVYENVCKYVYETECKYVKVCSMCLSMTTLLTHTVAHSISLPLGPRPITSPLKSF